MPGPQVLNPALWGPQGQLRDETARDLARRLRAGEHPDAIATAVGMSRKVARRRCREIASVIGVATAHDDTIARRRRIGELADAGWSDAAIGREIGRSAACVAAIRGKHFGTKYRVGRLSDRDRAEIDRLLAGGGSHREVATAVGCSSSTVGRRAREIGASKAAAPSCACGKRKGHSARCNALIDPAFIRRRLLEGFTAGAIAREIGISSPGFRVKYCHPILAELNAEGHRCGCGQALGHRLRCAAMRLGPRETCGPSVRKPGGVDDASYRAAYSRYAAGASVRGICASTGLKPWKVHALIAYWRARSQGRRAVCACGRPARHPGGCEATNPRGLGKLEKTRIEEAARAGERPREIAARLGVTVPTVVKHAAAVYAEMTAAGAVCACGRAPGHPWRCPVLDEPYNHARGRRRLPMAIEREALERLLRGESLTTIAGALGVGESALRRLRRTLDDHQRAQRAQAVREARAQAPLDAGALMALVEAAVPRTIEQALRDDVVAELHLALIERRLMPDQIATAARTFVNRAIAAWQSAWGPRSLDDELSPDGGRTLADVIGDSTFIETLNDVEIGQPPP